MKGNGHKTMKLHDKDPDFYAMNSLGEDSEHRKSSVVSQVSMNQPTLIDPPARLGLSDPSSPITPPSSESFDHVGPTDPNVSPETSSPRCNITEISNTFSSHHEGSPFLQELNRSIFIHELAMGCTILCQLRKGSNM